MKVPQLRDDLLGVASAVGAYFIWGLLPIYWKLIQAVPAQEILAHRFIWSFLFMISLVGVTGRMQSFCQEVRHIVGVPKKVIGLILAAAIISINWGTYIWAVNDDRVIEASLGYYMNPLVSVLLGVAVLKEKLTFWQIVSFLLALVGVLNVTMQLGTMPWVALILAVSFALYGLAKKVVNVGAMTSITLETLIIAPIALVYLLQLGRNGTGVFSFDLSADVLLLIGAGIVTAIPLILFSSGARQLSLTMLGFLQYLAPTISLVIGIFLYHEPFTSVHVITFGFIWCALSVFSLAKTKYFLKVELKLKQQVRRLIRRRDTYRA